MWRGGLRDGKGAITTKSGVLHDQPYGFASRFEGKPGTNPEERIGAAHAACFAMAMSAGLGDAGFTATQLDAKSDVSLEKVPDGFAITRIHLTLKAQIPGIDKTKFDQIAEGTKTGCPVSKVLKGATITLDATLV